MPFFVKKKREIDFFEMYKFEVSYSLLQKKRVTIADYSSSSGNRK